MKLLTAELAARLRLNALHRSDALCAQAVITLAGTLRALGSQAGRRGCEPTAFGLHLPGQLRYRRGMSLTLLLLSVIPSGQSFVCTPTAVWDGDGPIWCAEGPRIRLSGIAAREMDGSCSSGHPCPKAEPIASRDHLVSLVGEPAGTNATGHVLVRGPAMRCTSKGGAGGNRTAAFCVSPHSGDLSCAMVRDGYAARWDRYWASHRCD